MKPETKKVMQGCLLPGDKIHARDIRKIIDAEVNELINKPQFGEYVDAMKCEMAHHEQRWGDESKYPPHDFQMVLSMIAGKLVKAIWDKDKEKFEHHLITIGAVAGTAHRYFKQTGSTTHDWFNKIQNNEHQTTL